MRRRQISSSKSTASIEESNAYNQTNATSDKSKESLRSNICVECGAHVPYLVRDYGKGNVRLAICQNCNEVADKYVEYENILLFLDLMLVRPQVYRHVLHNLSTPITSRSLLKLFLILGMLDMNAKAYLVERKKGVMFGDNSMYAQMEGVSGLRISQFSIHLAVTALLENLVYFASVLGLIYVDLFSRKWRNKIYERDGLQNFTSAMCVSSFGKMFVLMTVIWEYHWTFIHVIGVIVFFSNLLAIQLFLGEEDNHLFRVAFILVIALFFRFFIQIALSYVGLSSVIFFIFV